MGIYVTRYLGPKDFGLLSYAISFVALFSAITWLCHESVLIRDLLHDESQRDKLLGTALVLKGVGAFSAIVIISLLSVFTANDRLTNELIFFIAAALIFQSLNVVDFYFQSKVLSKYAVYARCTAQMISAVIKVGLIYFHASVLCFAIVVSMESVLTAIGFAIAYRSQGLRMTQWKFKRGCAVSLLKDSWTLVLSGIAISVYMKIDQVMIKEMLGAEAVGIYAVAVNLCEVWYLMPMIICSSLFPAIVHARKNNYQLYLVGLQKLQDLFFVISFSIGLLVSISSSNIIHLLYGKGFEGAGPILATYIWSGIFVFEGIITAQFLVVENHQHLGLWVRVFSMFSKVGLNLLFIPKYGAVGSAIATLIAYSLPVYVGSLFHPLLRLNLLMRLKAFVFPVRLIYYGKGIYK